MQLDEDEQSIPAQAPGRRFTLGPLLVSLCLHALGLYALVEHPIEAPRESTKTPVAIHLRLVPPPRPEPLQNVPMEPASTADNVNTIPRPTPAPTLPSPLVDLPQRPDTVTTEPMPRPSPEPEALAPTRLTVRQMVDKLRSEEERQAVLQVCTPQQRRNPMFLCADEATTGFDDDQRESDDVWFAATSANSQGVANAARVRRIADSLRESGMSQSDIDRYVEGIDVNSQQRSTSGDARASAVRDQMFRNDSTYQQMKRVMNPWP